MPKGALLVGPPGHGQNAAGQGRRGRGERAVLLHLRLASSSRCSWAWARPRCATCSSRRNEKAPCIVFIDEIDTIGKKRDSSGMRRQRRARADAQPAADRDGRLRRHEGRRHPRGDQPPRNARPGASAPRPLRPPHPRGTARPAGPRGHPARCTRARSKLDGNIDLQRHRPRDLPARRGAELANIVNEAALRAVRMGRDSVTQADLEESVETVIAGYQRKNAVLSDKEKAIVAYHEIGHALVAALQTQFRARARRSPSSRARRARWAIPCRWTRTSTMLMSTRGAA